MLLVLKIVTSTHVPVMRVTKVTVLKITVQKFVMKINALQRKIRAAIFLFAQMSAKDSLVSAKKDSKMFLMMSTLLIAREFVKRDTKMSTKIV